jgi:cytochrome c biogenesis protein CcdA
VSSVVPFAVLYGVLLGARHALEPDHLAAVSTLAAHGASRGEVLRVAAAWGGGHATTVIAAGALLGVARLPAWLVGRAELAAGVTLIVLGLWTVYRVRRDGVHVHVHTHDGLTEHTHFHIHGFPGEHEPHPARVSWIRRPVAAYAVGTLHGLAGSGAAAALAALAAPTQGAAVVYLLCFGIGSLLGMVAVGAIALWPLLRISSHLPRARAWIESTAGVGSVAVGLLLVARVGGLFR